MDYKLEFLKPKHNWDRFQVGDNISTDTKMLDMYKDFEPIAAKTTSVRE